MRDRSLNVYRRGAGLRIIVRGTDHGIAVTEIIIEGDLKLKTGAVAKVAKQLFLIPVNNAHKEILDSRSDRLTRSVEDVQQNCGLVF